MPYYLNVNLYGLRIAKSKGDGYTITLDWYTAYPKKTTNKILYNIYMISGVASTVAPFTPNTYYGPPAFVSIDGYHHADIVDLIPGQMYHFGVRAAEYDPTSFDPSVLPETFNGLATLPQSLLAYSISATDTAIPLIDTELFPPSGVVKIGVELIYYSSVDYVNNILYVPDSSVSGSHFADLGGGAIYLPNPNNIGTGIIGNQTIVSTDALSETWTIICVDSFRNQFGQIIPGTAQFEAIGSISGAGVNPPIWYVYQNGVPSPVISNGIISFSIEETSTFAIGDSFTIEVVGAAAALGGRGYEGTVATPHYVDGYDGYHHRDPNVVFWPPEDEEDTNKVYECWNRFDIDHYPFTVVDGYRQKTSDILTTDLSYSDAVNTGFSPYDYAGYHRTSPTQPLSGQCIGSYIGGYTGCADGYGSVGTQFRGLNIQDQSMQRLEVLLNTDGEPVCLFKRSWTGITCECMLPYNEYPESRCNRCYGTGFVVGYEPFYDPRRSDGRILVRFDPTMDDLVATDSGLESTLQPNCWTLPVPTVKDRDFIIRFDENNNEEYRYEILNVTRNKLLLNQTGVQKFVAQRVRKTDPIYQARAERNTSMFPATIYTSISSSLGIPPHMHTIQINENILSVSQINQITGQSAGHSHAIENGVVLTEGLGHTHTIILP